MNRKTRNRFFWAGAVLLAFVLLFVGSQLWTMSSRVEATTEPATAVVVTGDLETTISANGNLTPATEAQLMFGMNGQVSEVLVSTGDQVEKGDVLVMLDSSSLERSVSDAEQLVIIRDTELDALQSDELIAARERVAEAEQELEETDADDETAVAVAESELEAAQDELDTILTPALNRNLTVAEAQLQQAMNGLAEAEDRLAQATLTAPFDGIISQINVREGDMANGVVLTMFDPDSLHVVLEIDEIDLRELAPGADANLTFDALPGSLLEGTVEAIASAPTATVGDRVTFAVAVELDEMDDALRNGMSAKVWLTTAERDDVLLVPNDAITANNESGTYFVTLIDGADRVRVEVEIGIRDRQFTEIESGLVAGDQLLLRSNGIPANETVAPPAQSPFQQ